jgi:hypothetical protein
MSTEFCYLTLLIFGRDTRLAVVFWLRLIVYLDE